MIELIIVLAFLSVCAVCIAAAYCFHCLVQARDASNERLAQAFTKAHDSAMTTSDEYREHGRMKLEYKNLEVRLADLRNAETELRKGPVLMPRGGRMAERAASNGEHDDGISVTTPSPD